MAEQFTHDRKSTLKIIIRLHLGLMFFLSLANRSVIRGSTSDMWDETISQTDIILANDWHDFPI